MKEESICIDNTSEDDVSDYDYEKAITDAAKCIVDSLANGDSIKSAHDKLYGHELSGFMAGAAIEEACRISPRGDELKAWWNKEWGGDGSEKTAINPAIIEIETR